MLGAGRVQTLSYPRTGWRSVLVREAGSVKSRCKVQRCPGKLLLVPWNAEPSQQVRCDGQEQRTALTRWLTRSLTHRAPPLSLSLPLPRPLPLALPLSLSLSLSLSRLRSLSLSLPPSLSLSLSLSLTHTLGFLRQSATTSRDTLLPLPKAKQRDILRRVYFTFVLEFSST